MIRAFDAMGKPKETWWNSPDMKAARDEYGEFTDDAFFKWM